ncbi:MAG TPA: TonB-dependent receptor, partial [Pseudomonadaceae bacterium]|nr:TonB-dependent receptor [Pseudomonadaceae bacterium]
MSRCSQTRYFTHKLLAVAIAGALGTPAALAQSGNAPEIESINITGSRIQRDGYSAPTPVTVLTTDAIQSVAPVDISESLALMPQFTTSSQPATAVQYANLRSIGAVRTLVLLDGRRHVPTFSTGVVDLTTIPTAMIGRTEIVTGGASASWGSDAVSGVVNLMLRSDLEGVTGNVQYGESRHGDDETQSISLAAGQSFADGRGHFLVGGEYAKADGIRGTLPPDYTRSSVGSRGSVRSNNYAGGDTQYIYADDVRRSDVYDGGLITSGPLRGTKFLPGGQIGQFGYGDVYGNAMIGGTDNAFEAPVPGGDLKTPYERKSFLTRLSYEFTDSLEGVFEYNYSESMSYGLSIQGRNQGGLGPNTGCTQTGYSGSYFDNINVAIDNAFLPQAVRDQMIANDIDCFNFGRTYRESEMGLFHAADGSPDINRFVFGLNGDINSNWSWDAYYQYGDSSFQQGRGGNIHSTRFQAAVDSVFDASGNIVCRINIDDDPSNNDPSCVPFNMFGAGSPSVDAQRYVTGFSWLDQEIKQNVAAVNLSGDLMQGWAGPISAAFGYEYRKEEISATADPDSEANEWQTSNRKGIDGSYDVNEIYAEVAIPLLNNAALADSMELSLAARSTDYSSSGEATTWKAGLTWDVNPDLRFRLSQSRDIRAGNLGELFTPTAVALTFVTDPRDSVNRVTQQITRGNPSVAPEEADTFTVGVVYSPSFVDGLQFSVDYYSIELEGQIGTLSSQEIVNQCYLNNLQQFCSNITEDAAGVIAIVDNSYFNLDSFETSGFDIQASYSMPLAGGDLSIRATTTYLQKSKQIFLSSGASRDTAGQFMSPDWKSFWNINYKKDKLGVTVDWRWYSGGPIDHRYIQDFAGLWGSNITDIGSVHFTGLNFSYDLADLVGNERTTAFLRIDNVFDTEAPFPFQSVFNDNYGRGFRAGVSF